jgi:hypothetical protein
LAPPICANDGATQSEVARVASRMAVVNLVMLRLSQSQRGVDQITKILSRS